MRWGGGYAGIATAATLVPGGRHWSWEGRRMNRPIPTKRSWKLAGGSIARVLCSSALASCELGEQCVVLRLEVAPHGEACDEHDDPHVGRREDALTELAQQWHREKDGRDRQQQREADRVEHSASVLRQVEAGRVDHLGN